MIDQKPKGLSQNDQIVILVVIGIVFLLIAAISFVFSQNPNLVPDKFKPNTQPFFENIEKVK